MRKLFRYLVPLTAAVMTMCDTRIAVGDVPIDEFALPTLLAGPRGITAGPDGNLWVAESDVDQIARVTPDGVVTETAGEDCAEQLPAASHAATV